MFSHGQIFLTLASKCDTRASNFMRCPMESVKDIYGPVCSCRPNLCVTCVKTRVQTVCIAHCVSIAGNGYCVSFCDTTPIDPVQVRTAQRAQCESAPRGNQVQYNFIRRGQETGQRRMGKYRLFRGRAFRLSVPYQWVVAGPDPGTVSEGPGADPEVLI